MLNRTSEKILLILFGAPFFLLSLVFPKRDRLWLFGGWFGRQYADNSRYLFEEVTRSMAGEIEAWWVTKDVTVYHALKEQGVRVVTAYSLRGIVLQLRAKVFVCCVNSMDFFPALITPRNYFVQLWHGTPLKAILLQSMRRGSLRYWVHKVRSRTTDRYSLICSPGTYTDKAFTEAFGVSPSIMFRAGYPRCDALLAPSVSAANVRESLGVTAAQKLWLYMPTHRAEGGTGAVTNAQQVHALLDATERLAAANVVVVVKPHFYEAEYFRQIHGNATVKVMVDLPVDLYSSLAAADGLITDYSSVAFDFAVLDRPIVFFPYDEDEYTAADRAIAFSMEEVGENVVRDATALVEKLIACNYQGSGLRFEVVENVSSLQAPLIAHKIHAEVAGSGRGVLG